MAFDKNIKSSRLLQSKRYTEATFDSQEAFTSVLDINANEIYTQQNLIPSSSIPYSGSASGFEHCTSSGLGWKRLKLVMT